MKKKSGAPLVSTEGTGRRTCRAPTVVLGSRSSVPTVLGNISRWEGVFPLWSSEMVCRLSMVERAGCRNGTRTPRNWSVGCALQLVSVSLSPVCPHLLPAATFLLPVCVHIQLASASPVPVDKEICNLESCWRPSTWLSKGRNGWRQSRQVPTGG